MQSLEIRSCESEIFNGPHALYQFTNSEVAVIPSAVPTITQGDAVPDDHRFRFDGEPEVRLTSEEKQVWIFKNHYLVSMQK